MRGTNGRDARCTGEAGRSSAGPGEAWVGNMADLGNRPLVCFTLAFCAGVAALADWGSAVVWAASAAGAVAAIAWGWQRKPALAGATALAGGALAGALVGQWGQLKPQHDLSRLPEGGQTLVGTVASAPRFADGVWRFVLQAEEHMTEQVGEPVGGLVYVHLRSSRPVTRGQRWRLTGRMREPRREANPGGRAEADRLSPLGVSAVLSVGADELAEPLGGGGLGTLAAHAYAAQRRALALLGRFTPGPYKETTAAVASSVIFGVHATPPPAEIADDFRRAGTIHLLVVSGAMVSMVFGFVFLPGALGAGWRRLRAERQIAWPLTGRGRVRQWPGISAAAIAVLVVMYYAVLTEGGQAVARAAAMGALVGLTFVLRRIPYVARRHGLNVDRYTLLAAAALGIVALQPAALSQPGFQLSFAAVWAIIFLTPKIGRLFPAVPRWLTLTIGGTLAAQLATFPILAWHYGQAPIGGLGANLLAVPLAGVVLAAGMGTCLLGVAAPWLAPLPGWITGLSTRWMIWVSSAVASVPWASPQVARPSWIAIVGWYVGVVVLGWWLGSLAGRGQAPAERAGTGDGAAS